MTRDASIAELPNRVLSQPSSLSIWSALQTYVPFHCQELGVASDHSADMLLILIPNSMEFHPTHTFWLSINVRGDIFAPRRRQGNSFEKAIKLSVMFWSAPRGAANRITHATGRLRSRDESIGGGSDGENKAAGCYKFTKKVNYDQITITAKKVNEITLKSRFWKVIGDHDQIKSFSEILDY